MDHIDFNAPAKLYTFPEIDASQPVGFVRGNVAEELTLGKAVQRFMELAPTQRAMASIGVDVGVVGANGLLSPADIEQLYARDDFSTEG